jgi:hypothetical protein
MLTHTRSVLLFIACLSLGLLAQRVSAASVIIEAGQTYTLKEDLVLTGNDVLEIKGTSEQRCTLVGNNHRIRTGDKWTGSVRIGHCTLQKLGDRAKNTADGQRVGTEFHAFDLKVLGKGSVTFENCTFDECSSLHIQNEENSTTTFRNNTVLENSLVAIDKDIGKSAHCFVARGNSKERKLFQGNFIPRGKVVFQAPNWLIGGDSDVDSNIMIGLRIGVIAEGEGTIVRGNYFHLRMPINQQYPYWSQISTFTTAKGAIGEHNVIRDGEWIVRMVEGEFRYNLIMDIIDHDLMQNGSIGRIHHNLFLAGDSDHRMGSMSACIAIVYAPKNPGEGMEIFNNVFDGGNKLDVPGIEVCPQGFVKSVRNNVFFNFAHKEKYFKMPQAVIRPIWNDDTGSEKAPRLGYADYNLFYNPKAKSPRNYLLSVAGKVERKDAGFGLNDIPKGGKIDEQIDPKFKGPIPKSFPFSNDDVKARKVTVSKILAFYRDAYSPAAGSPLIGAGDPADGEGANIGAIGSAKPSPSDRFGRFGSK